MGTFPGQVPRHLGLFARTYPPIRCPKTGTLFGRFTVWGNASRIGDLDADLLFSWGLSR